MDILNKTNIQNKILRAPEFGEETGGGGASSTPSNALFIGGVEVDKFYLGNSDDVKIFLGDVKLYPRDISYKLVAQYSDTTEYKVECNSSTSLTQTEVTSHTTPVSSMTSAVVSDCVNMIDTNAFSGASSLTSITIDDGVRQFGSQAFTHTEALREMSFPSSLTSIEGSCFRFSGIRKFNNKIPSGVTYLSSGCFADMYSLSAMTVPSSVTSSSDNLFLRDSGLTQVHFERETAPALGADAFKNCSALIKIYIPSCDCYNSYAAQSQFSGYTDLIYGEDGTKCKPETYNFKFKREHKTSAYTKPCETSISTLSSGQTQSGTTMSVITGTSNPVTAVTIGDCCNNIGSKAFSAWTKLETVTFSSSGQNKIVGTSAFTKCTSLKTVYFGNKVTRIESCAFSGCSSLTHIYFTSNTPPTFNGTTIFSSTPTVHVPCGAYSNYASGLPNNLKNHIVEDCNTKWVDEGRTACMDGYVCSTEDEKRYNSVNSGWELTGRYRKLSQTSTSCVNTPSIVYTNPNSNWSTTADTNGNITKMLKTASSTSELTTAVLNVSGVTTITFTVGGLNNSGIEISAVVNKTAHYDTNINGSGTLTINNLYPRTTYTINLHLLPRDGTYISGTNAHANITWS